MIMINKNNAQLKSSLFVFIHGAFRSCWYWTKIIDKMAPVNCDILLCELPEDARSPNIVADYISTKYSMYDDITIVGHSLGASYACTIAALISRDANIKLFLLSPPTIHRSFYYAAHICTKAFVAFICQARLCFISTRLREISASSISNEDMFSLVSSDAYSLLKSKAHCVQQVHVGYGLFDPLNMWGRYKLANSLINIGYSVDVKIFLCSAHHPVFTQPGCIATWIKKGKSNER